jgi:ornithine cyclodeaminase/alanine dehydrogenase-like protein (mu-crystallin family)
MKWLSREEVESALSMSDAIEAVRRAYVELATGGAVIPLRTAIAQPRHDGVTLCMPGYLSESDALAVKIVSVHGGNPARGLPRIHALVILLEAETGRPLAILEGGSLTALRTGAGSGVATALLARPDACTAAIFGAGVQARTQLLAVAAVRPLRRARIYAPRLEAVQAMIAELRPRLDPAVELLAAHSPAEAVRDADIICTATTSTTPVFDGADLQPGAHINAVGSYQPDVQEIDCETLRRAACIAVDSREAALAEAGDLLIALARGAISADAISAEIGEIAAGLKPGRTRETDITCFKSVGNAAQDVAVAQAVYRSADIPVRA